jgi:hypothetical protein
VLAEKIGKVVRGQEVPVKLISEVVNSQLSTLN